MLHALLQWRIRNINQSLKTQNTPHCSPFRVPFVMNLEKIDRVIMVSYYILPMSGCVELPMYVPNCSVWLDAIWMPPWMQFLPQDVALSIHLSDNRFTARPPATTVVSPPRKWAPWVHISTPQSASARFFAKCPLHACALYIPSLNNWQLTDVDGSTVKWIRRTVVEPLLKIYWHSGG